MVKLQQIVIPYHRESKFPESSARFGMVHFGLGSISTENEEHLCTIYMGLWEEIKNPGKCVIIL